MKHLSTGPRSVEGKARSSQNAIRHGFTARDIVIPGDLASDFESLQADLLAELQPGSTIEMQYFRQLLRACWNLVRIDREESRIFTDDGLDVLLSDKHAVLQRYRRQQERSRAEAMKALRQLQTERALRQIPALEIFRDESPAIEGLPILRLAERHARLRIVKPNELPQPHDFDPLDGEQTPQPEAA